MPAMMQLDPLVVVLFIYYFCLIFLFFYPTIAWAGAISQRSTVTCGILQGKDSGDSIQVSQACLAAAPGPEYICVFIERGWNHSPQRPGHHHQQHCFPCRCSTGC